MTTLNSLNCKGPLNVGIDQLVYSYVVPSDMTDVIISGLDGDDSELFRLNGTIKNAYNGVLGVYLIPNYDTSSAHYLNQRLKCTGTSLTAARPTGTAGFQLCPGFSALNEYEQFNFIFYSKSGVSRMAVYNMAYSISSTTVGQLALWASYWTNTADNITSLAIAPSQTNGIGAGSSFYLYSKRKART